MSREQYNTIQGAFAFRAHRKSVLSYTTLASRIWSVLLCCCLGFVMAGCAASPADPGLDDPETDPEPGGDDCEQTADSQAAFVDSTYHDFLQSNCGACHVFDGVAPGAFGDADVGVALEAFSLRESSIYAFAINPNHKPPFTGPQLQDELDAIVADYDSRLAADTQACSDDDDPQDTDPIIANASLPPVLMRPAYQTRAMTIGDSAELVTLDFDLGTDLVEPSGASFDGVEISLSLQTQVTATGEEVYLISAPSLTIDAAVGSSMRLASLRLLLNGAELSTATTFYSLDLRSFAGADRVSSTASMLVAQAPSSTDTLALSVGLIAAIDDADVESESTVPLPGGGGGGPIAPPTNFTELNDTNGLFTQQCVSCHSSNSPAGGLDITSYTSVQLRLNLNPGMADNSLLYERMVDNNFPMPPSGVLNRSDTDLVLQWIMDGAPEN